ncbi:hypothetical protein HID58_092567 [Brassica napus]|uniref:Phosphofructokinase domain-containing protein n=2 Tax=Brassica TaxID=3705 RepID=A0ABQ7WWL6_BRANA|nr:hypothetical protein HID58_092567 [Brassica napus]
MPEQPLPMASPYDLTGENIAGISINPPASRVPSVYSEVQVSRIDHALPLPSVFKSPFKIVDGPPSSAAGNSEEIAKLFPNLYGQPSALLVSDQSNDAVLSDQKLKVGVVLSGGQAPGGHNKKQAAVKRRREAVKKKRDAEKKKIETAEKKRKRDSGVDDESSSNPTKRPQTASSPEHQADPDHYPPLSTELPSQDDREGTPSPSVPIEPQKSPTQTPNEAENPLQAPITSTNRESGSPEAAINNDGQTIGSNNIDSNSHEAAIGSAAIDNDAPRTEHAKGSTLFGFRGGPAGIMKGKYVELTSDFVYPYRNQGGFDMICSGRDKIETPEQFKQAEDTVTKMDLDGLVVIGGDDSNTNACLLAEYFRGKNMKTRVIGCPKTIDGDLKSKEVPTSFGFDTACKIYSEMIGNVMIDARSTGKYYHFVRLMGRAASHITLECALQTHPNITIIGEEVAKIETEKMLIQMVETELEKKKKDGSYKREFMGKSHFFGYEGRCGLPTNFDATYCYALGYGAGSLLQSGKTGLISSVGNLAAPVEKWTVGGTPLTSLMDVERRHGKFKPVIKKAMVELEGAPFKKFASQREEWALKNRYISPGPIQFKGPGSDAINHTLLLELGAQA